MPSFLPAPDTELYELPFLSIYPLQEVSPATFCPQMLGSSPRPLLSLPAALSQSSNDNAILKALEVPAFLPENCEGDPSCPEDQDSGSAGLEPASPS